VQAICDWVHTNIAYAPGSSNPTVTALDVLEKRIGVCRDFALLGTAFCRALNIPARYTFGYLPDIAVDPPDTPMDFHAWFEVYLGHRWYSFDARHNEPRIGRVVIGRGRDAVDVALTTQYGSSRLTNLTVWADEVTTNPPRDDDADELEAQAAAREQAV
jgi:transglutaminase-like putative cysteine protease